MTLSWPGAVAAMEGGSGVAVAGWLAAAWARLSSVAPVLVMSLASVCMMVVNPRESLSKCGAGRGPVPRLPVPSRRRRCGGNG
jgi:hypothetical protein